MHQGTDESTVTVDSAVPLIDHDPDRSWITDLDPDHPKEMHLKCIVIPQNSKVKNCLLNASWLTNLPWFQEVQPDHLQVKSSCCCFPTYRDFASFVCI